MYGSCPGRTLAKRETLGKMGGLGGLGALIKAAPILGQSSSCQVNFGEPCRTFWH